MDRAISAVVINSQLGRLEQDRTALRDLLAIRPDFAVKAREELAIWWQPEMVDQMLGDLRQAGIGETSVAALSSSVSAVVQTV